MAAEAMRDQATAKSRRSLGFLDLPAETQQEIISHCSQRDLICVALVSKRFHTLASEVLYRSFHIIFPDEDDVNFDAPIDGLAGGLDTFTTSEYNYAKHLKDLSMDTLSAGIKGERSYEPYLYSSSCGKFLNTLLYLTIKKAKSLEEFRWNIRVELSRPVYQQLHRISSLKKLHVRMQAGESYYIPPPPLPLSLDPHGSGPSSHWFDMPSISPATLHVPSVPLPGTSTPSGGPPPALIPPSKLSLKSRAKRGSASTEPATLSGFKGLKSLCVLDIDSLDILSELALCVRGSSSTMSELQLSFSDRLAMQARKPSPDSDLDDSDVDDDFQAMAASQTSSVDATAPVKVFRAKEERKVQESVLARIFDLQPSLTSKHNNQINLGEFKSSAESLGKGADDDHRNDKQGQGGEEPRAAFIASIKDVSESLMALMNGSRDYTASQQDILDTIEKAARKYVESAGPSAETCQTQGSTNGCGNTGNVDRLREANNSQEASEDQEPGWRKDPIKSDTEAAGAGGVVDSSRDTQESKEDLATSKLFKGKAIVDDVSPDDIDIEHLCTVEDALETTGDETDEQPCRRGCSKESNDLATPSRAADCKVELSVRETDASSPDHPSRTSNQRTSSAAAQEATFHALRAKARRYQDLVDFLHGWMGLRDADLPMTPHPSPEMKATLHRAATCIENVRDRLKTIEAEIADAERLVDKAKASETSEEARRSMESYVRDTRGVSLEILGIHLIPVKASVLSRSINLSHLKSLTLLNVGIQATIWSLLSKENLRNRLALRSVFTDNVSAPFLKCMSQLDRLDELFILERNVKHKPESFAPPSDVTIDQIRRLVLKKHMGTLKRIMIKNESNDSSWDANEKTMILICTRGIMLEELAVSMNLHAVHAFTQYFAGLVNLRAINILHSRDNDTCIWLMREILRFIVDTLSHRPELKLEWIAIENDRVERVMRPPESSSAGTSGNRRRERIKAVASAPTGPAAGGAFPVLSLEAAVDSESDSDDDGSYGGSRLMFKTSGPMHFYETWGVKIFEKEIRSGRL